MARILVIDDDRNARLTLSKMLEGAGHNVALAADGRSGLKAVRSYKPDIILLDVLMFGMDGLTVLKEIRENNKTRLIPVIMLTGVDSDEAQKKALHLYAEAYLSKPISNAALLGTLEHVLTHRPTATESMKAVDVS